MHVALDIDDTITHAPEFFSALTHALTAATITILTFRGERDDAEATLLEHRIRYDRLICSTDSEHPCLPGVTMGPWKAGVVRAIGADVFFDDAPEIVHLIEPPTRVFMCCDELMRGWLKESLAG